MPTEIAQMLTLVNFGNAFLQDNKNALNEINGNLNFKYCKNISFSLVSPESGEDLLTTDTVKAWFEHLKDSGAQGLYFSHAHDPQSDWTTTEGKKMKMPARMSAGFVGGLGENAILVKYADGYRAWFVRWTLGDRDDPERRIWNVVYFSDTSLLEKGPIFVSAVDLKNRLKQTLIRIINFCKKEDETFFIKKFIKAKEYLEFENMTDESFTKSVYPAISDIVLDKRQLLNAASTAFVFGGMLSWNDTYFKDAEEYNLVSDQLFGLLMDILFVVND